MDVVAIASLAVAVIGIPAVLITVKMYRDVVARMSFSSVYEYVREHQSALHDEAWAGSSDAWKPEGVSLLARPGWILDRPVPLEALTIQWQSPSENAHVQSSGSLSRSAVPTFLSGVPYSGAILTLPGTRLFNGLIYRPVEVGAAGDGLRMTFTEGRYFDYLDSSEVLGYEVGERRLASKSGVLHGSHRRRVKDPFDLRSRTASLGVNTLTVRREPDGTAGFYMHRRGGGGVVNETGLVHVVPAGEFTPSDISLHAVTADFDIWKNIVREYVEEFLGIEDADGTTGRTIDFDDDQPYAGITAARRNGAVGVFVLGVGLDALCWKPELLTVAVFDAGQFDVLFAGAVSSNQEGTLVSGLHGRGIPFVEENIRLYADHRDTTRSAAACLELAWQHRSALGLTVTAGAV